ncbi:IS5 family transposase [Aeromonas salmonicida]|uniref:IS5 family transposase n=1 Tax=Aeromonas salmonicida TaxID=645 RepID=UPI00054F145E|nr:IS5 family transposase [Aeromonas salmonicida]
MGKSKQKISNWKLYNLALVKRGSLTLWMDEQAIKHWHCQTHHGRRGRGFHYSDRAIETALMLKSVFKLPLRALDGFINSLFQLTDVPLQSPDYSCISKRPKQVNIQYRLPSKGQVAHLVIDATGLKVYGDGEWKVRKHGKEKRRVWRKLHLAVDANTHAIVAAEVSLETVGDNEVLPTSLNRLRRKIEQVSADGAYDTKERHALLKRKGARPTIPPRKNAALWEGSYTELFTGSSGQLHRIIYRLNDTRPIDDSHSFSYLRGLLRCSQGILALDRYQRGFATTSLPSFHRTPLARIQIQCASQQKRINKGGG